MNIVKFPVREKHIIVKQSNIDRQFVLQSRDSDPLFIFPPPVHRAEVRGETPDVNAASKAGIMGSGSAAWNLTSGDLHVTRPGIDS